MTSEEKNQFHYGHTMNNFGHKTFSALVVVQGHDDESCGSTYAKIILVCS
jgi:hypothetical protein